MSRIELLDTTLRDGQQSLWGMRMQAGMALPVADVLDRTGFRVIDADTKGDEFVGPLAAGTCGRHRMHTASTWI